jgi:hypothetical protein
MARIGRKGFWRIFEAVMMLILLFMVMETLVESSMPFIESRENIKILTRHAEDFRNMICHSSVDRARVISNANITLVNSSMSYLVSNEWKDLRYKLVIYNASSGAVITTIGYSLPNLNSSTSSYEVGSAGCLISGEGGQNTRRKVLVMTWYPEGCTAPVENWAELSCDYRMKLTFDNSGSSENLVSFPVLVKLTMDRVTYADTGATDIRFYDADNSTLLYKDTEKWNATGNSSIWVLVPQIDAGSTTDYIWAYYDCDDTNTDSATSVWGSTYVGVWHLDEASGSATDSTSSDNDATTTNITTYSKSGQIGDAMEFDGDDDKILIPDSTSLNPDNITIEAWFKPAAGSLATEKSLIQKPYTSHASPFYQYALLLEDSVSHAKRATSWVSVEGNEYYARSDDTGYDYTSFHHIAGIHNGSHIKVYVNGVEKASNSSMGQWTNYTGNLESGTIQYKAEGSQNDVSVLSEGWEDGNDDGWTDSGNKYEVTDAEKRTGSYSEKHTGSSPAENKTLVYDTAFDLDGMSDGKFRAYLKSEDFDGLADDYCCLDISSDGGSSWDRGIIGSGECISGAEANGIWFVKTHPLAAGQHTSNLKIRFNCRADTDQEGDPPSPDLEYAWIDDITFTYDRAADNESDDDYTTYNNVLSGSLLDTITNISVTINITVYNNTGSSNAGNNDPRIQLEIYNGGDWVVIGNFTTGTGNKTLSTRNSGIMTGWETEANRDIRVRARYMDYNGVADEINFTGAWVTVESQGVCSIDSYSTNLALADYPNIADNSTYQFGGILDEIRVSNAARSAEWINATYLSGKDEFITYGSSEHL